jgi:hypothetical protein
MESRPSLAAVALSCVLTLTGCDGSADDAQPSGLTSPTSTVEARDNLPVGASAPFRVYAHCGFEFAQIDGRLWRTRLRDDGHGNPPRAWGTELVKGRIERVSESRAVFTGTNVKIHAVFRPAPHAQYMCD